LKARPTVILDFFADLRGILQNWFNRRGIQFDPNATVDKLCITFWNLMRREIDPIPRQVFEAPELGVLSERFRATLDLLRLRFIAGEDVNGYLSREAVDPEGDNFHDGLLNRWNIHHFHLGPDRPGERLVGRTGPLLYVMVLVDAAYFIAVLRHGHWSDETLLDVVHKHWPHLLKRYQIEPEGLKPSPEQVKIIHRKNGNLPYLAPTGEAYVAPGGGTVAAGIGLDVIMRVDQTFHRVTTWEKWLREELDLVDEYAQHGRTVAGTLTFVLENDEEGMFYAHDLQNKIRFRLGKV
jgi:hypothetical protein